MINSASVKEAHDNVEGLGKNRAAESAHAFALEHELRRCFRRIVDCRANFHEVAGFPLQPTNARANIYRISSPMSSSKAKFCRKIP